MLVKICGITRREDYRAALAAQVSFVGFVFHSASKRSISPQQAADIIDADTPHQPRTMQHVALTVADNDAHLEAILAAFTPDYWQLHGYDTTPERVQVIRQRYGIPIIRALPSTRLADAVHYQQSAAYLLIDSPAPSQNPGGHGQSFDWSMLRGWQSPLPWLLAGGLTPANVAAAICIARPDGVDVSSGVESALGVKDHKRITAFTQAARTQQ